MGPEIFCCLEVQCGWLTQGILEDFLGCHLVLWIEGTNLEMLLSQLLPQLLCLPKSSLVHELALIPMP